MKHRVLVFAVGGNLAAISLSVYLEKGIIGWVTGVICWGSQFLTPISLSLELDHAHEEKNHLQ